MSEIKFPHRFTRYLHGSKEENYDQATELGLTAEQRNQFLYACYEIALGLVMNEDGTVHCESMEGILLEKPVRV